ncbi:hypothetical protein MNBD_GAMMA12-2059 [hydrothermal vent metagenome]|uniref:Uncharacterized protein n=1 Tax=hydrothermal vent metagenome TaxID=652676 RepID=A0A3B0Y5Q3_9ZZZZ
MASGHITLKIHVSVNYENFSEIAEQFLLSVNGSCISTLDSADVLLWNVQVQGQALELVYDEMSNDFTLESDSSQGDAVLTRLANVNDKKKDKPQSAQKTVQGLLYNKQYLLLSVLRLVILAIFLIASITGSLTNFVPSHSYGLLSLGLAVILSWLIFRFLIHPTINPFIDLLSPTPFSWGKFWAYIKKSKMFLYGLMYLLRFKGFYIAFIYYSSFTAICFGIPVIFDQYITQPFSDSTYITKKEYSRRYTFCRYSIKIEKYSNFFASRLCIKPSIYRYIRQGQSIRLIGTQSWAGIYIKDIFGSDSQY